MKAGRWSVSAVWAVVGLTTLALAPAAAADHSITDLASIGPNGYEGDGLFDATSKGISEDGRHVFFDTEDALVTEDEDFLLVSIPPRVMQWEDVYDRVGATTSLVSVSSQAPATFSGASADGSRVFYTTAQSLKSSDTDGAYDVYERSGSSTTHVSQGSTGGNGAYDVSFIRASQDGSRVFFRTSESLVAVDTDAWEDIYERAGGNTTLVSTGPSGGNGPFHASLGGISEDGTRVFFETEEPLVSADTDTAQDVYQRAGGTTTLVSTGPNGGSGASNATFSATSQDGTRAFFTTLESMVNGDTDGSSDVYERAGGTTTLVSTGPTAGNDSVGATLVGASQDGTRVFFTVTESLVSADTDGATDIYERAGGTTTLISTGPANSSAALPTFAAASAGGSRVFFSTKESLVSTDTDAGASDVYERSGGTTTLISTGPTDSEGAQDAIFEDISQDGTSAVFSTRDRLVSGDTDDQLDVYVASAVVTTGFARPKGATPLRVPLVPVYEECANGNTTHGPPLAFESCNPPVPGSDHLTVGTPDANGKVANSRGSLQLSAIVGIPSTLTDEADIAIDFSLTDVRKQDDLSDYMGELSITTRLRITDRLNASSEMVPGTVADMPFAFTATCAPTRDTAIGGTCRLNTTLDGLIPGAIKEGKRSIFEVLGNVEVYDGGADADADTAGDNTLFAGSGLFVP